MKQFKSFPCSFRSWWVKTTIIVIILVFASHLSSAETFRDDFDVSGMELTGFDKFDILRPDEPAQRYQVHDLTREQHLQPSHRKILFTYILSYEIFYTLPDEPLTLRMNFRPSAWDPVSPYYRETGAHSDWAPCWDSDMEPACSPAEETFCYSDADDIRTMRIPTPESLALVVIGLLSLRFTRRLRY